MSGNHRQHLQVELPIFGPLREYEFQSLACKSPQRTVSIDLEVGTCLQGAFAALLTFWKGLSLLLGAVSLITSRTLIQVV